MREADSSLARASEYSKYSFHTLHILFAVLFAAVYRQQLLYSGNQHTKFLHAAAQADIGYLKGDWTAQTVDPLPAFTMLARFFYEVCPLGAFYVLFAILAGIFAYSAVGIAGVLHRHRTSEPVSTELALVFGVLILLFSMLSASAMRGVAGQYAMTENLQPSIFGVFIFLGLYLWLRHRRVWAAVGLAIAAMFHPGAYLLTSIILLIALLISSRRQLTLVSAGLPVGIFLALVGPLMAYQAASLAPTTPEVFAKAAQILANERIPRHTDVARWFDLGAGARFACMAFACWLVRRQPQMFWSLTALTVFGFVSSVGLLIWPNAGARFSTPWRVSAVAMPMATIILSYYASAALADAARTIPKASMHLKRAAALAFCMLSAFLFYRAVIHYVRPHTTRDALVTKYAKESAAEGQQYLVPPGMFAFRMASGLPTFVTYKTHPYKDVEVLAWWERINTAELIYRLATNASDAGKARELLDQHGITHVVVPANLSFPVQSFAKVHEDANFKIYARDGKAA